MARCSMVVCNTCGQKFSRLIREGPHPAVVKNSQTNNGIHAAESNHEPEVHNIDTEYGHGIQTRN